MGVHESLEGLSGLVNDLLRTGMTEEEIGAAMDLEPANVRKLAANTVPGASDFPQTALEARDRSDRSEWQIVEQRLRKVEETLGLAGIAMAQVAVKLRQFESMARKLDALGDIALILDHVTKADQAVKDSGLTRSEFVEEAVNRMEEAVAKEEVPA